MPTKANEDAVHKALREWSQAIANRKGAANRSKKLKAKAELKKKIDRLKADAIEDMDDEDEELAEDTDIAEGNYWYDFQCNLVDGRIDTVVTPSRFTIGEQITE